MATRKKQAQLLGFDVLRKEGGHWKLGERLSKLPDKLEPNTKYKPRYQRVGKRK